jgi:hypothetical protein
VKTTLASSSSGSTAAANKPTTLNCFVSFHKIQIPNSEKFRAQAIVIVSKYPFPSLFYRLLNKLDEAIITPELSHANIGNQIYSR